MVADSDHELAASGSPRPPEDQEPLMFRLLLVDPDSEVKKKKQSRLPWKMTKRRIRIRKTTKTRLKMKRTARKFQQVAAKKQMTPRRAGVR